jgi:CheY-like chemotaxis protein
MTGHATPPELPPGLLEEYLAGMRPVLAALAGLAERLAAARTDLAALEALRRETHKIHGSAGSFGFMEVSRLAAGMEATVKDWISWPGDPEVDRGSLTRWFVARLAEMLGLEGPRPAAAAPRPRVGPPPRPSQATTQPTQQPLRNPPPPVRPPASAPPPRGPPPPPPRAPAGGPTVTPAVAPSAPAGDVPEIVFVEDDAALAELLAYGLSTRGYRFVAYRNGREALKELLALDVRGTHPLLLLDVDLPALDGYSILDALQRARPGTYRVVFTTVHGTEEEQLRGLEAGALDYLVKPISLRVALEKIKRWVGK